MGNIIINYSDGTVKVFNALDLTKQWFSMSNDAFYDLYEFNFNPHKFNGLYENGRKAMFENQKPMDLLMPLC